MQHRATRATPTLAAAKKKFNVDVVDGKVSSKLSPTPMKNLKADPIVGFTGDCNLGEAVNFRAPLLSRRTVPARCVLLLSRSQALYSRRQPPLVRPAGCARSGRLGAIRQRVFSA